MVENIFHTHKIVSPSVKSENYWNVLTNFICIILSSKINFPLTNLCLPTYIRVCHVEPRLIAQTSRIVTAVSGIPVIWRKSSNTVLRHEILVVRPSICVPIIVIPRPRLTLNFLTHTRGYFSNRFWKMLWFLQREWREK